MELEREIYRELENWSLLQEKNYSHLWGKAVRKDTHSEKAGKRKIQSIH